HPRRRAQVEQPARLEEELSLLRKEEWKAGEVDDLLIGLDLREVSVDGEVRGQRRRQPDLGVGADLAAEEVAPRLTAHAVVLGLHGPAERIRIPLEITRALQGPKLVDRSFIVEMVESLRPAIRAPQVLLVLAADEPPHVEAELRVRPGAESQGKERQAKLSRPAGAIPRDRDLPDPVPVLVQVVHARELRVPHGAIRVGTEYEGAGAVVEDVDQ